MTNIKRRDIIWSHLGNVIAAKYLALTIYRSITVFPSNLKTLLCSLQVHCHVSPCFTNNSQVKWWTHNMIHWILYFFKWGCSSCVWSIFFNNSSKYSSIFLTGLILSDLGKNNRLVSFTPFSRMSFSSPFYLKLIRKEERAPPLQKTIKLKIQFYNCYRTLSLKFKIW